MIMQRSLKRISRFFISSFVMFSFSMAQGSRFKGSEALTRISRSLGPPNAPLVTAMAKPNKATRARARKKSRIMPPPFPWLRVYALRVLIALSIQRGLRAMRSDFLLAFFQRVQFPLSVSPYSLSCSWFGLVWLFVLAEIGFREIRPHL